MDGKKEYDLIVSLGGNCSVAHNLRYRGMRPFSLPFDWCYMEDESPIVYLLKAFENNFQDFFLKENLELQPATPEHAIIYKDRISGYYFPNHFPEKIKKDKDYSEVAKKIKRRIERLYQKIKESKKILFILATSFDTDSSNILALSKKLNTLFPDKQLDFRIMRFSSKENKEKILNQNVTCYQYQRKINNYDFKKTNFDWAFLDNIQLTNFSHKNQRIRLFSFKMKGYKYRMDFSWKKEEN